METIERKKSGFWADGDGNKSSSRLIGFITIIYAMVMCLILLLVGLLVYKETNIIALATSVGVLFTTLAGGAMVYMYNQKRRRGQMY